MGSVKSTKITSNNKIEYTVAIDYEESLILKGHATNVHIFSEDSANNKTKIISRGRGNTKYIKLPRNISEEVNQDSDVKCLRIESKDKIIIFTVIARWYNGKKN